MKLTNAENVLMLISLLKQYGIRKIIASPGTMNIPFIGSVQYDPFFEIYSSVDERSAAYMACGMAAESGEPVCLSCTGATASRNYLPGLTEAYYRCLPVIAITSTQSEHIIGHHIPQVIDRRIQPNDTVYFSTYVKRVQSKDDQWECMINLNKALIIATRDGGKPVHINLETPMDTCFEEKELPKVRRIRYFTYADVDSWPQIPKGRVGVFIGSHREMKEDLEKSITSFCETNNAVVFCDHTSNYFGKYRVLPGLVMKQDLYDTSLLDLTLLIHIGEISGAQYHFRPRYVWRVNSDGEIRDTFGILDSVFKINEKAFFEHYSNNIKPAQNEFLQLWTDEIKRVENKISELPFSNLWMAKTTMERMKKGFKLYLGILNSLRSWDYFDAREKIPGYANTGGFGIDGGLSSMLGGALSDKEAIHFGVFGDLGFFYDMNALGNRHLPSNIRLLIVNNGRGFEFRKYNHPASAFGEDADIYMAAAGHFGNQSKDLIKHYSSDLGMEYISVKSKEEYIKTLDVLLDQKHRDKPVLVEAFVDYREENRALKMVNNTEKDKSKEVIKLAKTVFGEKNITKVKNFLNG